MQRITDALARLADVHYSTSSMSDLLRQWGLALKNAQALAEPSRLNEASIDYRQEKLWPEFKKRKMIGAKR